MTTAADKELLARAVRNPGKLVLGPTLTSGSFPYGGVHVGLHSDEDVTWHEDFILTRDPSTGRLVEIARKGAAFPEIYCLLEGTQWDEDALLLAFAQASRQGDEVRLEGGQVPSMLQACPPLAFVANDPAHKSFYCRRPLLTLALRQSVQINASRHAGLPIRFVPTPTASTIKDWQVCRWENVTL